MRDALFFLSWLTVVIGGLVGFTSYQSQPGEVQSAPPHWPGDDALELGAAPHHLLFFAHPGCPCTRASLAELERLLARHPDAFSTTVLILDHSRRIPGFTETALVKRAREIHGVRVQLDPEGALRRRFGVLTSGQVLLYSGAGELEFSGGLTASRGHEGASAGSAILELLARGETPPRRVTDVFGCPLVDSSLSEPGRTPREGSDV